MNSQGRVTDAEWYTHGEIARTVGVTRQRCQQIEQGLIRRFWRETLHGVRREAGMEPKEVVTAQLHAMLDGIDEFPDWVVSRIMEENARHLHVLAKARQTRREGVLRGGAES